VWDLTKGLNILLVLVLLSVLLLSAKATYTVQNLNTTLTLNKNTRGAVTETFKVSINNASVSQYSTNRLALNLTLSDWQQLIGPMLVQHIINSNESLYNFKFFPGPVVTVGGQNTAYIIMTYTVNNVTTVNETAPRQFLYQFNPKVLNFEHAVSGEVLTGNTTFTIVVPSGAVIKSAYREPLSKFSFTFLITQSLQEEVGKFFESAYNFFGIFTYIIIAAAILLFMVYTYYRASR
jgi:hypothetical protein